MNQSHLLTTLPLKWGGGLAGFKVCGLGVCEDKDKEFEMDMSQLELFRRET